MSLHPRDSIVERALIPLLESLSGSLQSECLNTCRSPSQQSKERNSSLRADGYNACTRFVVLERLSMVTLSVTWSDPTLGHFAGQVWRRGAAQVDAFCALSGMPIHPGDVIFRPRTYDFYVSANADRMILESCLKLPISAE